ncbi:MAG: type pilus assembly protein PilC [Gaiellaceae bacterium]|nr:type pilus assembly protein PilC [Gaiellaceae bacterium]
MASFAYSAINAQGAVLSGEIQAPDVGSAREQLRLRGLLPERLDQLASEDDVSQERVQVKGVKPKSLQIFSRQFATMIEAGLSVVASLVILEDQTEDVNLSMVIAQVRSDVEGGQMLSEAMARHPTVFDRLYTSMVEAGETGGILDNVLDRVAIQIEKSAAIKRRVKGAMIYPTMVLVFAFIVLTGMLLFLVPVFVGVFTQFGGKLPTLTQYVVDGSNILKGYWFIIFPGIFGSIWSFKRWKKTESGRRSYDKFLLRVPLKIGDTVSKVAMARTSRTLATLVASGVDIIKSLEIAANTAGNAVIEDALYEVRYRVEEGVPIAQPLLDNPVFPPMVSQMVKIGEETGELDKMLSKVADFYEDEVDAAVGALTSIIEPIMMLGVGAVVGVIIIAMYMPMFKMLQAIH